MEEENTIFKAIALFERTCLRDTVSCGESGLFLALLHLWNRAGRPSVLVAWTSQLTLMSGLKSEKTVQASRDKLLAKGVIFFSKKGNRGEPKYSFNALFSKKSPFLLVKSPSKKTSKSPSIATSKRQVNGEVNGDSSQGEEEGQENNPPTPQGDEGEGEFDESLEDLGKAILKLQDNWNQLTYQSTQELINSRHIWEGFSQEEWDTIGWYMYVHQDPKDKALRNFRTYQHYTVREPMTLLSAATQAKKYNEEEF